MVGVELIAGLLEWIFGSIEGVTTALVLGFGALHVRKAMVITNVVSVASWVAGGLAVLVVLGIVDVNPGVAFELLASGFELLAGLLGTFSSAGVA